MRSGETVAGAIATEFQDPWDPWGGGKIFVSAGFAHPWEGKTFVSAGFATQKYLPNLNTIFKSNLSETQKIESLYDVLKLNVIEELKLDNKFTGIAVYLYEYSDGHINFE